MQFSPCFLNKLLLATSIILVSITTQANQADPASVAAPDTATINQASVAAINETESFSIATPVLIPLFASNSQIDATRSRQRQMMANVQAINTTQAEETVDVTEIDRMLSYLIEKAGHYPPRFSDREERSIAIAELKQLITKIDQHAVHPNASFDVLMRAIQLNQIGRNLDLGVSTAIKAGVYMRRAIALNPNDATANYWYGTMLVEGGGMKEGIPYLNRAIGLGEIKAHLILAQAYLHLERRDFALKALQNHYDANPDQREWTTQIIEKVRAGKSLIWAD